MLDLIIKNAIILTMEGKGVGLIQDGAVGIKDGTITCVDNSTLVTKLYNAKRVIDAKGKILLPGFIDAHCHTSYGVICRGILTDLEFFLEQGLAGYFDTLTDERMIISTKAHLLEGIKRGITTYCDMGNHMDVLSQVHEQFGVRARVSEMVRELPWNMMDFLGGKYEFNRKYAQENINVTLRLLDKYGTDPNTRISAMVSFQALDYVSEDLVIEFRELARKHNAMIHTHMSQSPFEMEQVEKRYGARPVEVFDRLGLLNKQTLAAHLVYNKIEENEKAAKSGLRFACCPIAWGEVGVTPPASQYLQFGGTLGIGTDEAAYTGINPIANMKASHASANVDAFKNGTTPVSLSSILRMHTIGSAHAIGMEDQIGSIRPDKKADLVIINPNTINMMPLLISPLTNIPQNIVCSATGSEIETVIIDGKIVVDDYVVNVVDEEKVIADIQIAAQEASEVAAEYFAKLPTSEILDRQRWFEETQ